MTALKNSKPFYVTKQRVAHEPDFAASSACASEVRTGRDPADDVRAAAGVREAGLVLAVLPGW
jgi:hypothetical protein